VSPEVAVSAVDENLTRALLAELDELRAEVARLRWAIIEPVRDRWRRLGSPPWVPVTREELRLLCVTHGGAEGDGEGARLFGRPVEIIG
jgi:hypothetical protein